MKKKTKKPIFDKRAPGGKMIVYGAVLVIIGGVINSYWAWKYALVGLSGAVQTSDVMGYTVVLCLQAAMSLIIALDGINNRNRPSKGRKVMFNALCVLALAVILIVQGSSAGDTNIVAAISMAGSIMMFIGGLKNRKVFGNGK